MLGSYNSNLQAAVDHRTHSMDFGHAINDAPNPSTTNIPLYKLIEESLTRPWIVGADRFPWYRLICMSIEYRGPSQYKDAILPV